MVDPIVYYYQASVVDHLQVAALRFPATICFFLWGPYVVALTLPLERKKNVLLPLVNVTCRSAKT